MLKGKTSDTVKRQKIDYPKLRVERGISIPKQVLEKALEIEASLVEQCEMLEFMEEANAVNQRLRVLHRGLLLLLHLHQEPPQLLHAHEAVRTGVGHENGLDVGRRLRRRRQPEPPLEAEANPVGLFAGHLANGSNRDRDSGSDYTYNRRRLLAGEGRNDCDLKFTENREYAVGFCSFWRHRGGLATIRR